MVTLFVCLQVLLPLLASADLVTFTVSSQEESGDFSSLDSAFLYSSALENVQLRLLPALQPFTVSVPVVLSQRLWIYGQGQSICLGAAVKVTKSGEFAISNATISQMDSLIEAFDIRGTLILENASIVGLQIPLIWLYGRAKVTNTHISHCNSSLILVKSGKAALELLSILAVHISASIVVITTKENRQIPFSMFVSDSNFEDFTELPVFSLYDTPGNIDIVQSNFRRNWKFCLDLAGSSFKIALENCNFLDNNHTTINIFQVSQTEIRLTNCTFSNNFHITILAGHFTGLLIVEKCTFRLQKGTGVMDVTSDGNNNACMAVINDTFIGDIHTVAEFRQFYNLIYTSYCDVHMFNVRVHKVWLLAPSVSSNSLLLSVFSAIQLGNVTVVDSGTSGSAINYQFCTVHISNFYLDNFYSGAGFFFFSGSSNFHLHNLQITKGSALTANETAVFIYKNMYFVFFTSHIEASFVSISDSIEPMGPCFSLAFSNYSISDVRFTKLSVGAVLMASLCSGSLSNLNIEKLNGDMHTFQTRNSFTSISNVTITDVKLDVFSRVIAVSETSAFFAYWTIRNCTIMEFFAFTRSNVEITSMIIEKKAIQTEGL